MMVMITFATRPITVPLRLIVPQHCRLLGTTTRPVTTLLVVDLLLLIVIIILWKKMRRLYKPNAGDDSRIVKKKDYL
jgi:hypothetical protein